MQVTRTREVAVPEPQELRGESRLYLDDLAVGRRFASATHVIDAAQIKAFAGQFDPQPFHLDDERAKGTLFAGLAASSGTPPRSPCASWLRADCRSPAASSGREARSVGPSRRGRGTFCAS